MMPHGQQCFISPDADAKSVIFFENFGNSMVKGMGEAKRATDRAAEPGNFSYAQR